MSKVRVPRAQMSAAVAIKPGDGSPPRTEVGVPNNIGTVGVAPWGSFFQGDDLEYVPELLWPQSVLTYNQMRNDGQLEGLHEGSTLPIRRYNWMIDPNGCDPAMCEQLALDLGIGVVGKEYSGQRPHNTLHDRHLYHAMLALQYGHYPMEIVGKDNGSRWKLTKLAPRPPQTIEQVSTDRVGDLDFIRQNVGQSIGSMAPEIPGNKLVWYSWAMEGGNWFGRSMLRSLFKNWLIKDRLLRIDAMKHERNGAGIPVGEAGPGWGPAETLKLQNSISKINSADGGAITIPYGGKLTLQGVNGAIPDTINSVRYHNEEMARRYLMMFMQLGESVHGNRALGETFVEFFQLNQDTIAQWYRDTTIEGVILPWWKWNVDPDPDYTPLLTYERDDDPREAFSDLALMVQSGVVQVDDELEEAVRSAMDLPPVDKNTIRVPAGPGDGTNLSTTNQDQNADKVDDPSATPGGDTTEGAKASSRLTPETERQEPPSRRSAWGLRRKRKITS